MGLLIVSRGPSPCPLAICSAVLDDAIIFPPLLYSRCRKPVQFADAKTGAVRRSETRRCENRCSSRPCSRPRRAHRCSAAGRGGSVRRRRTSVSIARNPDNRQGATAEVPHPKPGSPERRALWKTETHTRGNRLSWIRLRRARLTAGRRSRWGGRPRSTIRCGRGEGGTVGIFELWAVVVWCLWGRVFGWSSRSKS